MQQVALTSLPNDSLRQRDAWAFSNYLTLVPELTNAHTCKFTLAIGVQKSEACVAFYMQGLHFNAVRCGYGLQV